MLADGGVSYLLPYAQFLFAERESNPALEKEPDAPPEKLLIRFAQADVLILGSGLRRLETRLQQYELKFVKSADCAAWRSRSMAMLPPSPSLLPKRTYDR